MVVTAMDVLLVSRRQRPGMPLNTLLCTEPPPCPSASSWSSFSVSSLSSRTLPHRFQAPQAPVSVSPGRRLLSSAWLPSPCTADQKVPLGRTLGAIRHLTVPLLSGSKALYYLCLVPENSYPVHFAQFSYCSQQEGKLGTSYFVIARGYLLRFFSLLVFFCSK